MRLTKSLKASSWNCWSFRYRLTISWFCSIRSIISPSTLGFIESAKLSIGLARARWTTSSSAFAASTN